MTDTLFLTDEEVFQLTGYQQKARQVTQLRKQGVPFFLNAASQPRVARAAIEGKPEKMIKEKTWEPTWAKGKGSF